MASTLHYYTITIHEGERLTAEEFAALPDEPGVRMELDRGRVIKMTGVKDPLHDFIVGNLSAGTRLAWVAWPEQRTVDVWQPDEPMSTLKPRESLDGLEVVPGFRMSLADLFKPPFDL